LKQRYVYTPEMVFGGVVHDPGSDPAKVGKMLRIAAERVGTKVSPTLTRTAGDGVAVVMPETRVSTPCDIWLVTFDRQHHTSVARGENKGATLTNYNVVRSFEKLGTWNGEATTWKVSADRVSLGRSIAVVVQGVSYGPIVGAARLDRGN